MTIESLVTAIQERRRDKHFPPEDSTKLTNIVTEVLTELSFQVFSGNPSGVMALLEQYDPGKSLVK